MLRLIKVKVRNHKVNMGIDIVIEIGTNASLSITRYS